MKTIRKTMSLLMAVVLSLSLCVFAHAEDSSQMLFNVDGTEFNNWADALDEADMSGEPIVLIADYTLEENLTIPSGVTLVIPYDSSLSTATAGYDRDGTASATGAYVTLTVPTGTKLTVNGTLIVNAKVQGNSNPDEGCVTGTYGAMSVSGEVEVNGTLYARGYITGSGSMSVKSGASAYQLLQVRDWRGGTVTSAIYDEVFPINVFYFQNIMVPTTYEYNSAMYAQYFTSTKSTLGIYHVADGDAKLIGTSGAVFNMTAESTISTNYSNGALNVTTNGDITSGSLVITTRGLITNYTISTANVEMPLPNMNITVASGEFVIDSDIKMLPGSHATVAEGATLTINSGKNLYVYSAADYNGKNYAYNNNYWRKNLSADVLGSASGTKVTEGDATVTVNGTLTANGGLYRSASGAAIIGGTGTITNAATGTTTIKECVSNSSSNIVDVTFTAYAAAAASATEEAVEVEEIAEEPVEVEEIIEEPVEIIEIVEIEEAPIAA